MTCLFLALTLVLTNAAFAFEAKDIEGKWWTEDNEAQITIIQNGDKFNGKITWMQEPDRLDINSPDKVQHSKPILGLQIISGFKFEDGEYVNGKIYDPKSGKTYSCKMKLENINKLKLRGYIGISLIGRTAFFKRVEEPTAPAEEPKKL